MRRFIILIGVALLTTIMVACEEETTPPTVSIDSPDFGAPLDPSVEDVITSMGPQYQAEFCTLYYQINNNAAARDAFVGGFLSVVNDPVVANEAFDILVSRC